ncbi:MAG: nucleoside triphosphate pyrophosphohydrolase [Oscillospiraceae bacterium]|nr:nucleoside triphosphate pyrophosphohydrolase [Oscillospiraceae bacterium]
MSSSSRRIKRLLRRGWYHTSDLLDIIALLRAPGGCPWDAAQTHESIRGNFIEETYEVVEAINKRDDALLCEELGDVMLQIALHAQMASERGAFDWNDAADAICRKLIERHPHVFAELRVNGAKEALGNWDAIKRRSKGQETMAQAMEQVPRELPALMRGAKIQAKAARVGFDWPSIDGALERLEEELAELRQAIEAKDNGHAREELGDVLFSAVNVSRFIKEDGGAGCDPEQALTAATDKFLRRFTRVEDLARAEGLDMAKAPLEELDRLWELAKRDLSQDNNLKE